MDKSIRVESNYNCRWIQSWRDEKFPTFIISIPAKQMQLKNFSNSLKAIRKKSKFRSDRWEYRNKSSSIRKSEPSKGFTMFNGKWKWIPFFFSIIIIIITAVFIVVVVAVELKVINLYRKSCCTATGMIIVSLKYT